MKAIVRIHAWGVCHTDRHAADGDCPVKPNPPFISGHEDVGTDVGTRKDLEEALRLAARGLIPCDYETAAMEDINDIFHKMREGKINGRTVLSISGVAEREQAIERAA